MHDPDQMANRIYERVGGDFVAMSGQHYLGAHATKKEAIAAVNAFIAKRTRIVDAALAAADRVITKELKDGIK